MVVLSEGGSTPLLSVGELHEMGYKLIGYSGLAIGAAARSIQLGLQTLKEEGTTSSLADSVMPLLERNRLLAFKATRSKKMKRRLNFKGELNAYRHTDSRS